ncbi:MAG TPA: SH3-like domain-containing protein [Hyphomicrobiaceae bacterium]|nr:SH3-like domain-containing protein [Hyphomicrobiaceae bacterium]
MVSAAGSFSRPPRFKPGDRVWVPARAALGHCRTPWYVRGKPGVVAAVHGSFRDPERLAYHRPGLPAQVLYKVRFRQLDVWPSYLAGQADHIEVDIYEPWLEPQP